MNSAYVATLRQNPGRKAVSVEFRHPLRPDPSNQGKPGRKVRKGLGTDREAAEKLVGELNKLLADPEMHSPAARSKAEAIFKDPRVIEIFYDGIEPKAENFRQLRNDYVPFPLRKEGYPRILMLGSPGAGKTTLARQLIGSLPGRDEFPSTSVNRTTTFETEIIAGPTNFSAAITFMSEEEADFEVRQSVSAAILRAADDDATDAQIAKALLERNDMRFRLKYVLGDLPATDEDDDDPYAASETDETRGSPDEPVTASELSHLGNRLHSYLSAIRSIATNAREQVESDRGPISTLPPDERSNALDALQDIAEQSDDYAALVSDLLDDLRARFEGLSGKLVKTTTGWPRLWFIEQPAHQRGEFLQAVRLFSGIERKRWGRLLTPLVNGIRVAGPFSPSWSANDQPARFVLIDTEGLGHKANTIPDVPDHIIARFAEVDAILLVHKGDVPFSFEGGKALEAIGGAGQTSKTMMVFTRMDAVRGANIKGWQAKRDYAFSGVRNVVENQIVKALTPDVARFMLSHLEANAFHLGSLQSGDPKPAIAELSRLFAALCALAPPPAPAPSFPDYGSYDLLVLALQKGVEDFRIPWRAFLNIQRHSGHRPLPWQSVKAVSRRYAEGFDDGYDIRPASNLLNSLTLAVSRFLENPISWKGKNASPEEKRIILDHIKGLVSQKLTKFCVSQLREKAQPDWQTAYAFRGQGSTFDRRMKIESLYERWVPQPSNESDDMRHIQDFIDGVKGVVTAAVEETRDAAARSA